VKIAILDIWKRVKNQDIFQWNNRIPKCNSLPRLVHGNLFQVEGHNILERLYLTEGSSYSLQFEKKFEEKGGNILETG